MRCDQAGALEDFAVRTPTYLSVHGEWNRGNGRTVLCVGSIRALVCFTSVLYVRWFTLHRWIFFFFCFVQNPDAADLRLLDSHLATVPLSYSTLHYIDGE
jgi:hypothetical protein